jgi:aspartate aminotransferase
MKPPQMSPALDAWLGPQERFERLRAETMRRKGRVCDLAYANPYDGPAPVAVQAIRAALESTRVLDLQYTPYGGSTVTRRLVAQHLAARHGTAFDWRDIILTPGAMAALSLVCRAVRSADHGDEILVITPCWIDCPLYITAAGLTPVLVPVRPDFHLDLEAIARRLGPRTRAVVLSQPANPTGMIYTADECRALAALLARQPDPPLLVSDECHRDVRDPHVPVPSPLECYDDTCVVYSFGKSFAMQGQRIGYNAVSPRMSTGRAFSRHLERLCRLMGFCTPTALMQRAVRTLIGQTPDVGPTLARRARVVTALRDAGFDLVEPMATFFVYPRSPDPDDEAFVERLAAEGVLALPSSVFHQPGYVRLCLTASDDMIDRALEVMARVGASAHPVGL